MILRKYPRIITLLCIYFVTVLLFQTLHTWVLLFVETTGILGVFISGMMYTYSATGSIGALAFALLGEHHNPLILAVIGGVGSTVADLLIVRFISSGRLEGEIKELLYYFISEKEPASTLKRWIFTIIGFIVLASPLPDELALLILTKIARLPQKYIVYSAFFLNALGIYITALLFA